MSTKRKLREIKKIDFEKALDAFFDWKKLDEEIRELSGTRGINIPSEITEVMVTYPLGLKICTCGAGDAFDDKNNKVYEIKGSSSKGPNSFSPSEEYDEMLYVKLSDDRSEFRIYKTGFSSEDIKKIKVNETETVEDQQKQGRRPRFSIQDKIVDAKGLEPDAVFYIREKKIERKTK